MNFTFGIITLNRVHEQTIKSILTKNIPNFEILVVGGDEFESNSPLLKHIPFKDTKDSTYLSYL